MAVLHGPNLVCNPPTFPKGDEDFGPFEVSGRVFLMMGNTNHVWSQSSPGGANPWPEETASYPGTSFFTYTQCFDSGVIYILVGRNSDSNLGIVSFDCTARTYAVVDNFTIATPPTLSRPQFLMSRMSDGTFVILYAVLSGSSYVLKSQRWNSGWGSPTTIHTFASPGSGGSCDPAGAIVNGTALHMLYVDDHPAATTSRVLYYRKLFSDDSLNTEQTVSSSLPSGTIGFFLNTSQTTNGPTSILFGGEIFIQANDHATVQVLQSSAIDNTSTNPTWTGPTTVFTMPASPDPMGQATAFYGNFVVSSGNLWIVNNGQQQDSSLATLHDIMYCTKYLGPAGNWDTAGVQQGVDFTVNTPPPPSGDPPIPTGSQFSHLWTNHALSDGTVATCNDFLVNSGGVNCTYYYTDYSLSTSGLTVSCDSPPDGLTGVPYDHFVTASGGTSPYTFSITSGSLPPGLSLNGSTGEISGTPTTVGMYSFRVHVVDADSNTADAICSITITGPSVSCASPPGGEIGVPYSHSVTASGGTGPYTFAVTGGALPTGLSMASGGGITGTPSVAGLFTFTVEVTDSLGATGHTDCSIFISGGPVPSCNDAPSGEVGVPYSHDIIASGGTPPYTFSIISGALPTGLSMNSSGHISGTPSAAGTFTFTVQVTDSLDISGQSICSITITGGPVPSCASPPGGEVNVPYSHSVTATGGTAPYSFSIVGGALPAGLSMASSGLISGTPTAVGTFSFTVRVTDHLGATAQTGCSITIVGPVGITCGTLADGTVGTPYDESLSISGGSTPYTVALIAGSLPPGLSLNGTTGEITGTPTTPGTYGFNVQVTDALGGVNNVICSIGISGLPTPIVGCGAPPSGEVGVPYSNAVTATGGTPPYTFSIASGALPTGLTLNTSTGVISGTPTVQGVFLFTIKVTDANGLTDQSPCGIFISGTCAPDTQGGPG